MSTDQKKSTEMAKAALCVGYICPVCKKRVVVLRSDQKIYTFADALTSECSCGYARVVTVSEIQELETWRDGRV